MTALIAVVSCRCLRTDAGRSPSYLIRQLYDFRAGIRGGAGSALMKPVVDMLSMDDMIALAAYAASLSP